MPALATTFRWAFDPELFAGGLRSSADMFSAQARVRSNQFAFFIEPFTVLFVGASAGLVTISCLLPLFKLLNMLS